MHDPHDPGPMGKDEKQLFVEELQLAKGGTIQGLREVATVQLELTARPADSVTRDAFEVRGSARELRRRSVVARLPRPVTAGSFYELTMTGDDADVPVSFGRCDQVTMIAEGQFDVRFAFLTPIDLPAERTSRD
ncbi:MAG: hypothetical protein KAI24_23235 [Planctomycetes bacterium]|nr:hypothetical protein [Planctomycetota bacterium]